MVSIHMNSGSAVANGTEVLYKNHSNDTGSNTILAKVEVRTYLGKSYQYELSTPIGRLVVNDGSSNLVNAGETMRIMLPSTKIVLV